MGRFSVEQYVAAFEDARVTENQRRLLAIHYAAPAHTITAREMSEASGYASASPKGGHTYANLHYGGLAAKVGKLLDWAGLETGYRVSVFATFAQGDELLWVMRPEVVEAIERLGWVAAGQETGIQDAPVSSSAAVYLEGGPRESLSTDYERDERARAACIAHYGTTCQVCGFDFEATYGELGRGYIHVHHIVPLSEVGEVHAVDPLKDLVPLCANCHAMLHRTEPTLTPADLKARLRAGRQVPGLFG